MIFIVHPYDKSTKFLKRIKTHLLAEVPKGVEYFKVKTNDESHQSCINKIKNLPNGSTVLIMGHGRSDFIYGAKGDQFENQESDLKYEQPDKYYHKEIFIGKDNLNIFQEKKVISLTCNSNEKIGSWAIDENCIAFIGFGDLPTSVFELEDIGYQSKEGQSLASIESNLKAAINYIIKKALEISIIHNYTFDKFIKLIRFLTNQRISDLLTTNKKFKERKVIANLLYNFKQEISIYGDNRARF